jgi:hypothetical protein
MAGHTYRLWVNTFIAHYPDGVAHLRPDPKQDCQNQKKQLVPSTTSTKLPAGKKKAAPACAYALNAIRRARTPNFPTNPGYGIFYSLIGGPRKHCFTPLALPGMA